MQFLNIVRALEIQVLIFCWVISGLLELGPNKSHKSSLFFLASSSAFLNKRETVKLVKASPISGVVGFMYPTSIGLNITPL